MFIARTPVCLGCSPSLFQNQLLALGALRGPVGASSSSHVTLYLELSPKSDRPGPKATRSLRVSEIQRGREADHFPSVLYPTENFPQTVMLGSLSPTLLSSASQLTQLGSSPLAASVGWHKRWCWKPLATLAEKSPHPCSEVRRARSRHPTAPTP